MKQCTKCKELKYIEQFTVNRVNKSGYQSECKQCKAEYVRSYYKTHKAYRQKIKDKSKAWYENNKDRLKEKYIKKREYIKKALHQYKKHPDCPSCGCFKDINEIV